MSRRHHYATLGILFTAMIIANIVFGFRMSQDYPKGAEYRVYGREVATSYNLNPSEMAGYIGTRQPRRLFLALEASRGDWRSITVVGDLGDVVYEPYIAAFSPETSVTKVSGIELLRLDSRDATFRNLNEEIQFVWASSCNTERFADTQVISRAMFKDDSIVWGNVMADELDISIFLVMEFARC